MTWLYCSNQARENVFKKTSMNEGLLFLHYRIVAARRPKAPPSNFTRASWPDDESLQSFNFITCALAPYALKVFLINSSKRTPDQIQYFMELWNELKLSKCRILGWDFKESGWENAPNPISRLGLDFKESGSENAPNPISCLGWDFKESGSENAPKSNIVPRLGF